MSTAVILAGGKGTRLAERLGGLPKPLVDVAGRPLLERQIDQLATAGVDDILLLVSHGAEHIERFVKRLNRSDVRVRLLDDGQPKGTAGAVLAALDRLPDRFLVVYGDTLFHLDIQRFLASHVKSKADATLFLHPNDHPQDSDIVEIDDQGWVQRFHPYPRPAGRFLPNLVNAAFYAIEKRALMAYRGTPTPSDFGKNLFATMLADGAKLKGYASFEYIKDLGTPKRLEKVEHALKEGVVARASLKVPQKAVFVDRDGTLNVWRGFINDPDQIELLPGVAQGVRRLNESEFRVVVITNQPVIARGEASFEQLRQMHYKLESQLGQEGAFLDAIYFCPHHPDKGFPGEVTALKIDCDCRKPKIGLITRAAGDLHIDLSRSWMIGDTARDILTAGSAGLKSIQVLTGEPDSSRAIGGRPDFVCDDFAAAVEIICDMRQPLHDAG